MRDVSFDYTNRDPLCSSHKYITLFSSALSLSFAIMTVNRLINIYKKVKNKI